MSPIQTHSFSQFVPTQQSIWHLENQLNEIQKKNLRQHNQRDDIKIVGFDWLHKRAETTLNNLIKHGFERLEL